MSVLMSVFSIIILPFALLWGAITSSISQEANIAAGNIVVHSREEAQKAADDLITQGKDVSACNKIKAAESFGFSSSDVLYICIQSFAESKEDPSICKLHIHPETIELCINKIAKNN